MMIPPHKVLSKLLYNKRQRCRFDRAITAFSALKIPDIDLHRFNRITLAITIDYLHIPRSLV